MWCGCFGPGRLCAWEPAAGGQAGRHECFCPCELLNIWWEVLSLVQEAALWEHGIYRTKPHQASRKGAIREAAIFEAFYSSIKSLRDFPAFLNNNSNNTTRAWHLQLNTTDSVVEIRTFRSLAFILSSASATLGAMATGRLLSVPIYRSVVTQGYTQSKIPHIAVCSPYKGGGARRERPSIQTVVTWLTNTKTWI